jgi:hypothetical protein
VARCSRGVAGWKDRRGRVGFFVHVVNNLRAHVIVEELDVVFVIEIFELFIELIQFHIDVHDFVVDRHRS